jgi:hypothetical protein
MANQMLSSAAASALISTLNDSAATTSFNDYIYTEASNIAPPQSVQWVGLDMSSGSASSGNSIHFDITKDGFLTKAILAIDFSTTGASGDHVASAYFNTLDEITLSTNGRRICSLNRQGILSKMAYKPQECRQGYAEALQVTAAGSTTALAPHTMLLNLDMFFAEAGGKFALQTTFLQPIRCTVRFRDFSHNVTANAIEIPSATPPKLYCCYRQFSESITNEIVNKNYDSGLLSQLIASMDYENPERKQLAASGTTTSFSVNVKSTACVERCYILVCVEPEDKTSAISTATPTIVSRGFPLKLVNDVVFKSGGQEHVRVPADLLMYYGVPSSVGTKQFGSMRHSTGNANGTNYVYCIDFTMGNVDTNELSNLVSLRELSTPQIEVTCAASTAGNEGCVASCYVLWDTRSIASTSASSGRYQISLSN